MRCVQPADAQMSHDAKHWCLCFRAIVSLLRAEQVRLVSNRARHREAPDQLWPLPVPHAGAHCAASLVSICDGIPAGCSKASSSELQAGCGASCATHSRQGAVLHVPHTAGSLHSGVGTATVAPQLPAMKPQALLLARPACPCMCLQLLSVNPAWSTEGPCTSIHGASRIVQGDPVAHL